VGFRVWGTPQRAQEEDHGTLRLVPDHLREERHTRLRAPIDNRLRALKDNRLRALGGNMLRALRGNRLRALRGKRLRALRGNRLRALRGNRLRDDVGTAGLAVDADVRNDGGTWVPRSLETASP